MQTLSKCEHYNFKASSFENSFRKGLVGEVLAKRDHAFCAEVATNKGAEFFMILDWFSSQGDS